jgi:hypothetical protein
LEVGRKADDLAVRIIVISKQVKIGLPNLAEFSKEGSETAVLPVMS